MPLLPAAVALAMSLAGIRGPSFWLDESATVSLTGRPTADMLRVFDDLDLVHAPYYLIMRPWAAVFGTGELALRLPSALAASAYPDAFGRLRDIGLEQSPVRAENIKGRDLLPRQMRGALIRSQRVWVMRTRSIVTRPGDVVSRRDQMVLATGPWRVAGTWRFRGGMLTLLERTAPYQPL